MASEPAAQWPCRAEVAQFLEPPVACVATANRHDPGYRVCASQAACLAWLAADAQVTYRHICERAAAGSVVFAYLEGYAPSPERLLRHRLGE